MTASMERWRPVPINGLRDRYEVSDRGRVRNRKGQILKPFTWRGYLRVKLWTGDRRIHCRISRLVALAFVPNVTGGQSVLHRNDVKTDNRAENLYWGTHAHNTLDAIRNGRWNPRYRPRYTAEQVRTVRRLQGAELKDYIRQIGVHPETARKWRAGILRRSA